MELKYSTRSVSVKMYAHQLRIETGRYQNLEDKVRICLLYDSGEIESEIHFLMDCFYFSDNRQLFFNFVQKIIPNFNDFNSEKQFLDLFSTEKEIILKKLVQFIRNSLKKLKQH